jgi:hypothetical protein
MKDFPLAKVYQLIEPGPVVLLSMALGSRRSEPISRQRVMLKSEFLKSRQLPPPLPLRSNDTPSDIF